MDANRPQRIRKPNSLIGKSQFVVGSDAETEEEYNPLTAKLRNPPKLPKIAEKTGDDLFVATEKPDNRNPPKLPIAEKRDDLFVATEKPDDRVYMPPFGTDFYERNWSYNKFHFQPLPGTSSPAIYQDVAGLRKSYAPAARGEYFDPSVAPPRQPLQPPAPREYDNLRDAPDVAQAGRIEAKLDQVLAKLSDLSTQAKLDQVLAKLSDLSSEIRDMRTELPPFTSLDDLQVYEELAKNHNDRLRVLINIRGSPAKFFEGLADYTVFSTMSAEKFRTSCPCLLELLVSVLAAKGGDGEATYAGSKLVRREVNEYFHRVRDRLATREKRQRLKENKEKEKKDQNTAMDDGSPSERIAGEDPDNA